MHGLFVEKPEPAKCSPAAEKRCKEGNESGACECACGGANHGIYKHLPDFDLTVEITGMYGSLVKSTLSTSPRKVGSPAGTI